MTTLSGLTDKWATFMKWHPATLMAVDFVLSSYASNFLPGAVDRPWGILVGPPSVGKTELLRSLRDHPCTVARSSITPNAFVSAYRDEETQEDVSLYACLAPVPSVGQRTLVLEDLTTILKLGKEPVDRFFGQLRAAFDGHYDLQAGNVGAIHYDYSFGFLAACTSEVDLWIEENQQLGERSAFFRFFRHMGYKDRRLLADHVRSVNRADKATWRSHIADETTKVLNHAASICQADPSIDVPDELAEQLGSLAALSTSFRTLPSRRGQTLRVMETEGPGRFLGQLKALGDARCVLDGRTTWQPTDLTLVRRVAQDSMAPHCLKLGTAIFAAPAGGASKSLLVERSKLDTQLVGNQLQQWLHSDLVWKPTDSTWALNPDVRADATTSKLFED